MRKILHLSGKFAQLLSLYFGAVKTEITDATDGMLENFECANYENSLFFFRNAPESTDNNNPIKIAWRKNGTFKLVQFA